MEKYGFGAVAFAKMVGKMCESQGIVGCAT